MSRYEYYMGKGISYPQKWESFEGFYEDMGKSYEDKLIIDRINGNESYSKKNCRWVNYVVQNNNRSNNIVLKYNGEKLTVNKIAELTSLLPTTIYNRRRRGWSDEKIINTATIEEYRRYK